MGMMRFLKSSLIAAQEYFFDHSEARFTANPKLALRAQTLDLRPFRVAYNLNSRSELAFLFHRPQ
jgi:hypothetical protein